MCINSTHKFLYIIYLYYKSFKLLSLLIWVYGVVASRFLRMEKAASSIPAASSFLYKIYYI